METIETGSSESTGGPIARRVLVFAGRGGRVLVAGPPKTKDGSKTGPHLLTDKSLQSLKDKLV